MRFHGLKLCQLLPARSEELWCDLRRAEEALDRAEVHLARSGGEAYTEALILSYRASLRSSQCRFREAVQLLNSALAIYRQAKDRHLEGKVLIQKGMALGHDGRFQQAIRCLRPGACPD